MLLHLEGTLLSSAYNKNYSKGRNKVPVRRAALQIKVKSIRKLSLSKAQNMAATGAANSAPPYEVPFLHMIAKDLGSTVAPLSSLRVFSEAPQTPC